MAAAMSLDGKIADDAPAAPQTWGSPEDAEHFNGLRALYDTIVMGRKTYDVVSPRPNPDKLRVVITRHPADYAANAQPDALEFTDQPIPLLVEALRKRGRHSVLVAGGGEINGLFLGCGLIDDLFLTVEPVILGQGVNFVHTAGALATNLTLQSVEQLNTRGTLLFHYLAERPTEPEHAA